MTRLLVKGEWYEAVSAGSIFETDFERLLLANAADLYPGFHLVAFKKTVQSEHGSAMADLALIDCAFRDWWVVEVELAVHSLRGHVEPQVATLATASYGSEEADYLLTKNPGLHGRAVRAMMQGLPPRVLVLVNAAMPEWVAPLRAWSATLGVVEIFRSRRNQEILRINGTHPEGMGNLVSVCWVDGSLRNCLVVASPGGLDVVPGAAVSIGFRGGVSQWRRVEVVDRVWLMPLGRYPLPENARFFRLTRGAKGELTLELRPGVVRQRS